MMRSRQDSSPTSYRPWADTPEGTGEGSLISVYVNNLLRTTLLRHRLRVSIMPFPPPPPCPIRYVGLVHCPLDAFDISIHFR